MTTSTGPPSSSSQPQKPFPSPPTKPLPIRIATINVQVPFVLNVRPSLLTQPHLSAFRRYDGHSSNPVPIPPEGSIQYPRKWNEPLWNERPWAERRSRLVDALGGVGGLDLIGMQEVLHNQLEELSLLLGDSYAVVGVGRDDGKQAGEYSPIFYNKQRFTYLDHTYKWLSPPGQRDIPGSKSWDAAQTRIATFLTLLDREDGDKLVHVINTHYDDQGKVARGESSLVIREEGRKWVDEKEKELQRRGVDKMEGLIILTGDFNSPVNELGYQRITSNSELPSGLPSLFFTDNYHTLVTRGSDSESSLSGGIMITGPVGPSGTYTGFNLPGREVDERIDFIFLGSKTPTEGAKVEAASNDTWFVSTHVVVDNIIMGKGDVVGWTGRWSDHRAVVSEIRRSLKGGSGCIL